MKVVAAGKFKAKFLALIDEIARDREPVIITKYGKPVVKVVPVEKSEKQNQKPLKGTVLFLGDVVSPIDEQWEAEV
ncbi:type II toxin-antitoxin system prevent-host-death family antitoxin [candidate division KSB1 bacterium]|nr:type II toxin-antitoxin system prevent-host-death family antitoxin [candidate division KSB1 bacterium]